jgi:hypothetical protein
VGAEKEELIKAVIIRPIDYLTQNANMANGGPSREGPRVHHPVCSGYTFE